MSKRTRTGNSLVAVAYIRVSKDEQRLGPDAQRAAIAAWAACEGVQIAAWHVDPEGSPGLFLAYGKIPGIHAGWCVLTAA